MIMIDSLAIISSESRKHPDPIHPEYARPNKYSQFGVQDVRIFPKIIFLEQIKDLKSNKTLFTVEYRVFHITVFSSKSCCFCDQSDKTMKHLPWKTNPDVRLLI